MKLPIYGASAVALLLGVLLVAGESPILRALGVVLIGVAALMILLTMASSDDGGTPSRFGIEDQNRR